MNESNSAIMDLLKADATVSYRKKGSETVRAGLDAQVEYDPAAPSRHTRMPTGHIKVMVTLYNNASTGISLNADGKIIGDAILVAPAPGVTAKWCTIVARARASHSLVTWEVR